MLRRNFARRGFGRTYFWSMKLLSCSAMGSPGYNMWQLLPLIIHGLLQSLKVKGFELFAIELGRRPLFLQLNSLRCVDLPKVEQRWRFGRSQVIRVHEWLFLLKLRKLRITLRICLTFQFLCTINCKFIRIVYRLKLGIHGIEGVDDTLLEEVDVLLKSIN